MFNASCRVEGCLDQQQIHQEGMEAIKNTLLLNKTLL